MDENNKKRESFMKYVSNPRAFTLKKWLIEMLKEDYVSHDDIVDRVSTVLVTDTDLKELGALLSQIYDKAYRNAINDYKAEAEKLGIKVNISHKAST